MGVVPLLVAADRPATAFRVRFVVPGDPVAQPRHRDRVAGGPGRPFVQRYAAPKEHPIHQWRATIRLVAQQHRPPKPLEGPVSVTWDARFASPKSNIAHPRGQAPRLKREWHTKKPDRDNLDKAILDELRQAGFFGDDSQVCSGGPQTKRYVLPGAPSGLEGLPGLTIEIEELEP